MKFLNIKLEMKVLVISHMYPSTFNEVLGIFVHEQVKELVRQGCEVKVVSPVPWSPFPINRMSAKWKAYSKIPKQQMWEGIEVFYPRYIEFPRNYVQGLSGLFMYLGIRTIIDNIYRKYKFDIIHAHVAYPDGYVGLKLKHKYKVPLVVTIHGLDVCSCAPHKPTIERNSRLRKTIIQVFEGANKVIGVSSKVRDIILKYYSNADKVVFVNNGVSAINMSKNNGVSENQKIKIISVGYLNIRKGHEYVIRALVGLKNEGFDFEYLIVGDGENRWFLENLTKKLMVEDKVKFVGRKNQSEVYSYLNESDIFCLPSWDEAFGVVYIEAMSVGLPVIACKGQGIEDVITDGITGLLAKPKDTASVEDALRKLIRNPRLRHEIGQQAKELILSKFTWSANVKRYIEIYQEILS